MILILNLILVSINSLASSRFFVGASVKTKTRPPGSILSKRTCRPWVILSALSPPREYLQIFFDVRRLNNLNPLDQLQVVQKLHVVLRRKLEVDVSILFVRNIGDCDEHVFLDLLRKCLNIPDNLFRDCVDQHLAFLLRARFVYHEPDLNFAIGTDSQRSCCVLTGSSASGGKLLANICSVTICVRVAAQEGLALEVSVAHGPP